MAEGLCVALVEDDPYDAKLVEAAARRGNLDVQWLQVESEVEFAAILGTRIDAVVTDFNLPSFSALKVLDLVHGAGLRIPVLVVTGAIDDELASECLKRGAADYLLKDRLARFPEALKGAIERFGAEARKRDAELAIIRTAGERSTLNQILLFAVSASPCDEILEASFSSLLASGLLSGLEGIVIKRFSLPDKVIGRGIPGEAITLEAGGEELGELIPLLDGSSPFPSENPLFWNEVLSVTTEVLERARAEERLARSLEEKEDLLREIHHKVKNNLAIISSLVALERMKLSSCASEVLGSIESRIDAMALIHEAIYANHEKPSMPIEELISLLMSHYAESSGYPIGAPELSLDCRGLVLNLESSVTVGILINELIGGAMRRAASSRIMISFSAAPNASRGGWNVTFAESMPANAGAYDTSFLKLLVEQFDGTLESRQESLRAEWRIRPEQVDSGLAPSAGI
jgi:two-component sensor histidine kinase/FixJ family two-component response regulator